MSDKSSCLERILYDFDIALLQETLTENLTFTGYISYFIAIRGNHNGQAVLVKTCSRDEVNDMKEWDKYSVDLQGFLVATGVVRWSIINIYAGYNWLTDEENWRFLSEDSIRRFNW